MKKQTREEIEREYAAQREAVINQYYAQMDAAKVARDAALAELDDPMLRLIAAAKEVVRHPHDECEVCAELNADFEPDYEREAEEREEMREERWSRD